MSLYGGAEFADFGAGRSCRNESARLFNSILAGELAAPAGSAWDAIVNWGVLLLGWLAFLTFVFVPSTQLVALCLCAAGFWFRRSRKAGRPAHSMVLSAAA